MPNPEETVDQLVREVQRLRRELEEVRSILLGVRDFAVDLKSRLSHTLMKTL